MTYFEIFNKVMLELNYRPITVFENIFKSEHLRILENINRVNIEVNRAFEWSYLRRCETLLVNAGDTQANNVPSGRILSVWEGGRRLHFDPYYENYLTGCGKTGSWSLFGEDLLLPSSKKNRELTIFYNTNKIVIGAQGEEKENFTDKDDKSIIPSPFAEQVLVWGACIRTKANPNFPKFAFWNTMFKSSMVNLRATCTKAIEDEPRVKV